MHPGIPAGLFPFPANALPALSISAAITFLLIIPLVACIFLFLHVRRARRALTALRESRRKYRNLVESIHDVIWETGPDLRFTYMSPRVEEILGHPPEEFLGKTFAAIMTPEEASRVQALIEGPFLRREPVTTLETLCRGAGGKEVFLETSARPLLSEDGAFLGYRGISRDITERRRASEELHESEMRFAKIFSTGPSAMAISTLDDGLILEANENFLQVTGYGRSALVGKTALGLGLYQNPADRTAIVSLLQEQGHARNVELKLLRKGGLPITVLYSAEIITLGSEQYILTSTVEITELKLAEKALRESEERLHLALQGSNDGFWDWDMTTDTVRFSTRWAEMLGYSLEELEPHVRTWERLIHPDDQPAVEKILQAHLNGRTPKYEAEHRLRTKSGQWRWILDRGMVSSRDASGRPLRMTGTHTDITDRMQAMEELRYRFEFEKLITSISTSFIKLNPERIDAAIKDALKDIGRFCDVDRSNVFLLSGDLQVLDNSHEWCAPGIKAQTAALRGIPVTDLPWLMDRLRLLEDLHIPSTAGLPPAAASEKALLESRSTRSMLAIPMSVSRTLTGFVGFESVRAGRVWSRNDVSLLRLVAEIFASGVERKRAEQSLQESRKRYMAIVEDQTELISRFRPDGTLTFVNEAYCRYFRRNREEFLGRPFFPLLPEGDRAEVALRIAGLGATSPMVHSEHRVLLPAGEVRWQERTDRLICDGMGKTIEIQSVGRDITERKQATEDLLEAKAQLESTAIELRQALRLSEEHRRVADLTKARAEVLAEEAKAASRAKSTFLANMSHEIRTPLSAILGYAELIQQPSQDRSETTDRIHQLRMNAEHLLAIVNDILDLSKIEAGQMDLHIQEVPLAFLVHEVAALTRTLATGKGLGFRLICEGRVPGMVRTDPVRLKQILINLASNAVKFTDRGGVTMRLRMETSGKGGSKDLCLAVEDTGIGIAADKLGTIFTPFTQVYHPGRRYGGTGLGLDISKRLTLGLGGTITAASESGVGSVFTYSMPVPSEEGAAWTEIPENVPAGGRPEDSTLPSPRLDGTRVLLVEDGYDNQRIIRFFLEEAGARVEVAENGAICLDQVKAAAQCGEPYDAILMDLELPVLDGHAATRRLRQLGVKVPIIALTAYAMPGDRERCLASGCTGYLSKPVVPRTLIESVRGQIRETDAAMSATEAVPGQAAGPPPTAPATTQAMPSDGEPWAEGPPQRPLSGLIANTGRFESLIRDFLEGLPRIAGDLETARRAGDAQAVTRLAHRLRGSGGMYGFTDLGAVAGACEDGWRRSEPEVLRKKKLDELLAAIAALANKSSVDYSPVENNPR